MLRNRELSDKGRKSCSNHLYESMKQRSSESGKEQKKHRKKKTMSMSEKRHHDEKDPRRSLEVAGSSDGWNKTNITCCGFGSGVITGFGLEPPEILWRELQHNFCRNHLKNKKHVFHKSRQPDKRLLSSNQLIRQRALHMVGTEKFEELVVTLDGALFEKYGTMSGDSIELSNIVDMLSNIREKIPNAVRQYRAAENKVSHLEMGLAKAKERYWL
ncbi:unnamed protein product [Arabidopsis thaliana]|uniref:Uncharacterized protein n=1 Tax=Arabidopsis thaliana TaxID=3702 RepID=Q9MBH3_ARATH|nr:unnamed protein product [Arabidopsis thaliana]